MSWTHVEYAVGECGDKTEGKALDDNADRSRQVLTKAFGESDACSAAYVIEIAVGLLLLLG